MEEDIKMLEWSQQQMRLGNLPDYNQKVYKAIENLIKEYKKEKDLRIHYENRLDNMEQLYIDKDKVEEIINEELKELYIKLNPYEINNATPEKERTAGAINELNKLKKLLKE